MNDLPEDIDDVQALERRLEWATASTAPASTDMDAQTAALREAWTVWGRLLENAQTPMETPLLRRTAPKSMRRRWLPVGAGLAAAMLAVIAATAWIMIEAQRADTSASLPQTVADDEPKAPTAEASPSQAPAIAAVVPQAAADPSAAQAQSASAAEPKWSDTVDDEIVQVSEKLLAVQQDWHTGADAFDTVRARLDRIHAEIDAADGTPSSSNSNPNEKGC